MSDKMNALIDAAEERAKLYDDDDRQDIKADVMNAFFAGAKYAEGSVKSEAAPLTATHGPIHLTNRKTAEIAKTDYNIIGYVLRREDGDAVCISAESAVRWLPEAHYWRLMHEQDGSLFANPTAITGEKNG